MNNVKEFIELLIPEEMSFTENAAANDRTIGGKISHNNKTLLLMSISLAMNWIAPITRTNL